MIHSSLMLFGIALAVGILAAVLFQILHKQARDSIGVGLVTFAICLASLLLISGVQDF